jgi:CO/xanthine dehydrogenase FAD-binding subunit
MLPRHLGWCCGERGNGGVYVRPFEYLIPESVDEAISMRLEHGDRSRFIAGGTELVVLMKAGKLDVDHLVELSRLEALRFLRPADGGLSVGPLTTHAEIEGSPHLRGAWAALAEASASIREPQVKNLGTIGGNVAIAVPSADTAPPLLALDAVLTLQGPQGLRSVPISEFFVAPYRSSLGPAEMLVEILLPGMGSHFGSAFCKLGRHHDLGLSVVTVAASLKLEEGMIVEARVAMGVAAPTPRRVVEAEAILLGERPDAALFREVGRLVSQAAAPRPGSIRGSPEYKHEVLPVLTQRALGLAAARASTNTDMERGQA